MAKLIKRAPESTKPSVAAILNKKREALADSERMFKQIETMADALVTESVAARAIDAAIQRQIAKEIQGMIPTPVVNEIESVGKSLGIKPEPRDVFGWPIISEDLRDTLIKSYRNLPCEPYTLDRKQVEYSLDGAMDYRTGAIYRSREMRTHIEAILSVSDASKMDKLAIENLSSNCWVTFDRFPGELYILRNCSTTYSAWSKETSIEIEGIMYRQMDLSEESMRDLCRMLQKKCKPPTLAAIAEQEGRLRHSGIPFNPIATGSTNPGGDVLFRTIQRLHKDKWRLKKPYLSSEAAVAVNGIMAYIHTRQAEERLHVERAEKTTAAIDVQGGLLYTT